VQHWTLLQIKRVVDELLEDDKRPILIGMAGLVRELLARAEFGKPRGFENMSTKGGRTHVHAAPPFPRWPRARIWAAKDVSLTSCVTAGELEFDVLLTSELPSPGFWGGVWLFIILSTP
jgi:hypothetical protein